MAPEVIGSLVSAGGSLLGGLLGQGMNVSNMERQAAISKDLMRYQWNNFSSPAAQIASLNKAGLGVNAYLGGKGSVGMPSGGMPSSAPITFDGIADLGNIASYIQSVAQAKKAGMDTKLSEQEIKNKEVERQRNEFELNLRKQFGKDVESAALANAYMNLVLASDQSDLNEIQKAIGKWNEVKAQAESKASEYNRDIMKQVLDNNPTALRLENRLKELQGSAAAAQAAESFARARTEEELRSGRKLALDLSNELQGLENDFNYETYQKRLEQFASQVGIVKWSLLTSEMEYKDRNAYHALQRLMLGKGSKQDGVDVFKFLRNHSTEKFDINDLR